MATYSGSTSQSSDDAREAGGGMSLALTYHAIAAATQYGGHRFTNVTIPQGATINSATMTVSVTSRSYDDPDLTIYGEDTDDAATFTTDASNISTRAATTATASWSTTGVGAGAKQTPSIAEIVQEIVNRPGWASGNDMVIIFKGNSASSNFRYYTYDNPGTITLNIDYTAGGGGGGGQPPRSMHQFRQRKP